MNSLYTSYQSPRTGGVLPVVGALVLLSAPYLSAQNPCANPANAIVAENCLPGNPPSDWDVSGIGDTDIQGFATDISVNRGDTIDFKIRTDATTFAIDIYRIGYYQGNGARKVASILPSVSLPQIQPPCLQESQTQLIDCGNWAVSASWAVPASAVSGVYVAKLKRTDATPGFSHILFVVRDDASSSDLLFQTSDTTWVAYNRFGGASLYFGQGGRGHKASYNRPLYTRLDSLYGNFFSSEYAMVRWLERNGYDLSYISGVDTDRDGARLLQHSVYLSVGHDEYWSGVQRANVEAARDAGVHLAFFSGNEAYWKTRYEPSIDSSGTPYRTLVCYKETRDDAKIDPNPAWTGSWRDPRFSPPSDGGRPENALTGTLFHVDSQRDDPIFVSSAEGKLRFWRNTPIAALADGDSATLPPGVLGYEWDTTPENGFRPEGLIHLSTTAIQVPSYLVDHGKTTTVGFPTHHLVLHRRSSGALVFGAGTVQWPWGLDAVHDNAGTPTDSNMQQATVNLFADMGVQPATLQPGLVPAAASSDVNGPQVSIANPAEGATLPGGVPTIVSGQAVDAQGVVAAVEVSTDGGVNWRVAQGREDWSFKWTPTAQGPTVIQARAVDDSGNIGAAISINQTITPPVCPCTLWDDGTVPSIGSTTDASPVTVGVKLRVTEPGFITGVRFYKGLQNTGVHVGSLWSTTGQLLAQATFTAETASGWQQVSFASPVAVSRGQTYVASYYAPNGGHAFDGGIFLTDRAENPPLLALSSSESGGNGVFTYNGNGFPAQSFGSANYWVDVVFDNGALQFPPTANDDLYYGISEQLLSVAAPGVLINDSDPNSDPLTAAIVTSPANGSLNANPDGSFTYLPDPGFVGIDAFVYRASDGSLESADATAEINVIPCCSGFPDASVPATASANDTQPVELGVKFRSSTLGSLTAVRFYKGPNNPGPHVANLWTAEGQLIATASFENETPVGWQEAAIDPPAPILANKTYVVSYHAPNGGYAFGEGFFNAPHTVGPLTFLAQGQDGPNGVFRYGSSGFPTSDGGGANFWVDVRFSLVEAPNAPPVGGSDEYTSNQEQTLVVPAPGLLGNDFDANGQPLSSTVAGAPPNGSVQVSPDGSFTYTPNPGFIGTDSFSYSLSDGLAQSNPVTVTLRVKPCPPCSLFSEDTVPAIEASSDTSAVELGVKFVVDQPGLITAIRFYKGPGNTGAHTGSLWAGNGTRLATGVFTAETASGWQRLVLDEPVVVGPGAMYVASYFAPNGRYAFDANYFVTAKGAVPVRAPAAGAIAGNGVYRIGAGFPNQTYQASNYWVDVEFEFPSGQLPPNALGEAYSVNQDGVLQVNAPGVLANDVDPGGAPLTALKVTDPANGTVQLNADGSFIYTPVAGFTGEDAFTYRASNGGMVSDEVAVTITVNSCPCSLFSSGSTPAVASANDPGAVELGTKFTSGRVGFITGIRFYKGAANTGVHVGNLWTSGGALLASTTFANESATGWQEAAFDEPVAISAGETYVASYFAPNGGYAYDTGFFGDPFANTPLVALAGNSPGGNGVYRYVSASAFPSSSGGGANYWVDVVFEDAVPDSPNAVDDAYSAVAVQSLEVAAPGVLANDSDPFSSPITAVKLTDPVHGSVELSPDGSFVYMPTEGFSGVDSFTYAASNGMLQSDPATVTIDVTSCPCTIWNGALPGGDGANDPGPVTLGVRFRASRDGLITGIRFYKHAANTGLHEAILGANDGTVLATATFQNETAEGWQQVDFVTPVPVTAGQTYIAGYYAPNGGYAATGGYFATSTETPVLTALADGVDGGNGLYLYAGPGVVPTSSYNRTNYWVDVVFDPSN